MANPTLTDEQLRKARAAFEKFGSQAKAAKALGIERSTLARQLRIADARLKDAPPEIELPDFPDEDVPIEDIIGHMAKRFKKRQASYDAHTWFPVNVRDNLPIGLLAVGDPHLDDNGANWPLIQEHARICAETDGMYAVNIGDSTNCWGGRLIRKYADQDTSLSTARRLVEWFMLDSGVRWLVWLYANHEHMGDGSAILGQMSKRYGTAKVVMHDWEARFVLRFPNGVDVRIFAAHDFPGNSMWNPLHGQVKAARFGSNIDVLIAGHKHNWAISQWELADQDVTPLMIRVRGYKYMDDYARRIGVIEQREGASVLLVVDPNAKTRGGRTLAFQDVEQGADYLTYLREKATGTNPVKRKAS